VDVILWFDTEDYLLPADDDATKRLADLLAERKIRATFKMVGEKARVLEKRGRKDVIAALKRHDIAYHTDYHSVHPTPTEYLADCGWLDGVAEFIRRESAGAADVRRIFGVETLGCYGQPGSSWAPQAIAALPALKVSPHGVPCYVDEGDHIGLEAKPFWYAGALNVYRMRENCTRMDLHDPDALEPAKAKVSAIAARERSATAPGLISIYYHPCEWVHQEFWDAVNFKRGANPPRSEWKEPPQRPAAETETAFRRFGEYVDYIRSIPGVHFVTASDLPLLYPDPLRARGTTEAALREIATRIRAQGANGLSYLVLDGAAYSLADQFELLLRAADARLRAQRPAFPLAAKGLFGPDAPPPALREPRDVPSAAFQQTVADAVSFVQTQGRVPARVFIGPDAIAPADFLLALAEFYLANGDGDPGAGGRWVPVRRAGKVTLEKYVAEDTPGLFGGWIIHPEGLRAPRLLELARLQTWTLKPALRASPGAR
jgi:hypothetical protein